MINWLGFQLRLILGKVLTMKAEYAQEELEQLKAERAEAEILIKEIMDALGITPD